MNSSICTLFEGHYHYGVAALSNSLYNNGFRGAIYVGYLGELPNWALKGKKKSIGKWEDAITLSPIEGLELVFIALATNYSLTNYKPDFMLELWEGPAQDADALFYFDPDIVVDDSWSCFEQWVNCGVALCEDVNSPLQECHPRRVGWRNYYNKYGINLNFKNQIYVNGGFVGLLKSDISFLTTWIDLQEKMAETIGGLDKSIFSKQAYNSSILKIEGFQIFDKSDQDALNATIEVFRGTISYFGKDGMGFEAGKAMMFHALGDNKPWKVNFIFKSFNGRIPRLVDEYYWKYSNYPIVSYTKSEISKKKLAIKISKFIGRFYKV